MATIVKQRNQDTQKGMRRPWANLLLASGLAVLSGCGNPDSTQLPVLPKNDGGGESVSRGDGIKDAKSKSDARTERGTDLSRDARRDSSRGKDTLPADLAMDRLKPDTKSACGVSAAGSFSGLIYSGTPQTVGGYSFGYKGKKGLDAYFDISCGSAVIVSGQVCPLGKATTITVAQDGKLITITPLGAGTNVVNASISVN